MFDGNGPRSPDDGVERHEVGLIAKAKFLARDRPGERFVAVVAEAETPEAKLLLAKPSEVLRAPGGSVAGFVMRDNAKKFLGQITPQLLDWLEDEGEGSHRKLPVIHAARGRMRTASIEYDVDE